MITLLKEVAGRKLLYVMAAQQEYGPNLQARFKPLMTGVGPVEAAVQLTSALHQMQASDAQPDLVVSLGSAGSSKLEQTQVYQVSSVSFALLRVCQHFDVPLAGLRGISDGKSEVRHIDNWTEYLHIIDEKLADTVDRLEAAIGEDIFLPPM